MLGFFRKTDNREQVINDMIESRRDQVMSAIENCQRRHANVVDDFVNDLQKIGRGKQ